MRFIVIAFVLFTISAGAAAAATPLQATRQIAACFKTAGAGKVTTKAGRQGTVYFTRPFNALGRWLGWSYLTSGRRVVATVTIHSNNLRLVDRRRANRCLRPFNGHV